MDYNCLLIHLPASHLVLPNSPCSQLAADVINIKVHGNVGKYLVAETQLSLKDSSSGKIWPLSQLPSNMTTYPDFAVVVSVPSVSWAQYMRIC